MLPHDVSDGLSVLFEKEKHSNIVIHKKGGEFTQQVCQAQRIHKLHLGE